jgi:hypothetical protein
MADGIGKGRVEARVGSLWDPGIEDQNGCLVLSFDACNMRLGLDCDSKWRSLVRQGRAGLQM